MMCGTEMKSLFNRRESDYMLKSDECVTYDATDNENH